MGSKQANNESLLSVVLILSVQEAPAQQKIDLLKVKS